MVVSKGPAPVPVPNVVGATLQDAKQALGVLGFVVDDSKTKFSTTVERGRVIRQSPDSGKELQPGGTVTLVISLGPKHFPAPDFRSMSRADAQALADQYGLHVTFSTLFGTSGQLVWSQSPGVGVTVQYGDTIPLFMV